jgi:hypothetical protein
MKAALRVQVRPLHFSGKWGHSSKTKSSRTQTARSCFAVFVHRTSPSGGAAYFGNTLYIYYGCQSIFDIDIRWPYRHLTALKDC